MYIVKDGIRVINVDGEKAGTDIARELLYAITGTNMVLYLSGGKTPQKLYSDIAKEQKLKIGAVAMVDERYGRPMHNLSNELVIERTGLPGYLKSAQIPYYPILKEGLSISDTASRYNDTVRSLFAQFSKSVAILGIGEDGHIAGIAPNRQDFTNPLFSPQHSDLLVSYFIDPKPMSPHGETLSPYGFGERITMTIRGLHKLYSVIILTSGEKKKAALIRLFEDGPIEQVPSRIIKMGSMPRKTILITDQKV